jgi:hypothetical protein
MKAIFLLLPALLALNPIQSSAHELNSWGDTFSCAVDWFAACAPPRVQPAVDSESSNERATRTVIYPPFGHQGSSLPEPVRNVLENPSPATAKAYITWSRQANEKLRKATEYIAQASRDMNTSDVSPTGDKSSNTNPASGLGPVGLYYFFSPGDQTLLPDVAVLNKIFQEGRLGVVGIPVRGKDEEIVQLLNEAKPLFPVRRSDAEVRMIKPSETPDLYLAFPLEKKIFPLGSVLNETLIKQAIENILVTVVGRKSRLNPLASVAADGP